MQPNYIMQLNRFNAWLDAHYLSPHAQLLWFRMIGLFNACGWADRVQIDTNRLIVLSGTGSNKAAYTARDALVNAGLLTYQKGKKGKPSLYRMRYFPCSANTENATENNTETAQKRHAILKRKRNQTKRRILCRRKN